MARILVAGAGALGSAFGGFLRLRGHDVTLLGRTAHIEAIRQAGLKIEGIWGEHTVRDLGLALAPEAIDGCFDMILVAVKSYDTVSLADAIEPFLAPQGCAISLQNGLGNVEVLQRVLGPQRVLGARVIFGATLPRPGCVRITVYAEPVLVGVWGDATPALDDAAQRWAERFEQAGIPSVVTTNLPAALWSKVFYNAALNPLGALLGVHYGALVESADLCSIMDEVITEAYSVARAEGIDLPFASADAYRQLFYSRLVPSTYDHRSSMLQDLERGRRTEIDAINGAVWRLGARHSIPTSANSLLTRLVRARSRAMGRK